jgi:membrane protein
MRRFGVFRVSNGRGGKLKSLKSSKVFTLLHETFAKWTDDKGPRMGAALAFYAVFSIPPLMMIALGLLNFIFSGDVVGRLHSELAVLLGDEAASTLLSVVQLKELNNGMVAALIGIAILFSTASGVFIELQDALNTIWGVRPAAKGLKGLLKGRLVSCAMVLGICVLLLVSLALTAAITALSERISAWIPGGQIAGYVLDLALSLSVITLLFAMIFKILPATKVRWNDVWIGAAVTALLFTIGKLAIGIYIGKARIGSGYGVAGSIVILITWVYYSAQIMFFGAEFTNVWAKHHGSRALPEKDTVQLDHAA